MILSKGEIFIANTNYNAGPTAGTVSVISDSSNNVIATINVGEGPLGVAYDSAKGEIFVSNEESSTISVISDSNNNVVATANGGSAPEGLAYDSAKSEIFVANYDSSSVSVISDKNNALVETVQLSGYSGDPTGLAYDPSKGEIFETSSAGASVFVISDSNNAVVATAPLVQLPIGEESFGPLPLGIAYDSAKGELFISDSGSNAVSILSDSSSGSSSPSASTSLSASPTSSSSAISPTPTVPEFNSAALVTVAAAIVIATLSTVAICKKKSKIL